VGVVAQGTLNNFKHAIDIAKHVIVPEAEHAVAVRFQRLRPLGVSGRGRSMVAAVQLHNQVRAVTGEIDDVLLDADLSAEMGILHSEAMTQVPPEFAFCFRRSCAHFACEAALGQLGD
jgi:hypothetical protein